MEVPDWAHANDVRVDIRRSRLSVTLSTERGNTNTFGDSENVGGETEGPADVASPSALGHEDRNGVIIAGALSRPVQVDECLWTMERPGRVHLYLQKELPSDGEPGFEWWATVLDGDEEVDVLTCDAGSDASKYPEHARRRGAKALWENQRKTPQERRNEVWCTWPHFWLPSVGKCHVPAALYLSEFVTLFRACCRCLDDVALFKSLL